MGVSSSPVATGHHNGVSLAFSPRAGTKACKLITKACKLIRGGRKVREAKRKVIGHSGHIGIKKNLRTQCGSLMYSRRVGGEEDPEVACWPASFKWKASVRLLLPQGVQGGEGGGDDKDHSVLSLEGVCGPL